MQKPHDHRLMARVLRDLLVLRLQGLARCVEACLLRPRPIRLHLTTTHRRRSFQPKLRNRNRNRHYINNNHNPLIVFLIPITALMPQLLRLQFHLLLPASEYPPVRAQARVHYRLMAALRAHPRKFDRLLRIEQALHATDIRDLISIILILLLRVVSLAVLLRPLLPWLLRLEIAKIVLRLYHPSDTESGRRAIM